MTAKIIQDFFAAQNAVVHGIEIAAPFYPNEVKQKARQISESCMSIINFLGDFSGPRENEAWYETLEEDCSAISRQISELEELIRQRLNSLTIIA